MNLLMFSNLYPKEIERNIRAKQTYNMYDAANELQWNIIDGLYENHYFDVIKLCNLVPVDSWPEYYRDCFIRKHIFSVDGKTDSISVPFCNIKYLKYWSIKYSFIDAALQLCDDASVILLYSLNATFLSAVKKIKERKKHVKCVAIVADLPQFTSSDKNILRRLIKVRNVSSIKKLMPFIDGYILLTEQMAIKMNIDKHFIVVEGIAKENQYRKRRIKKTEEKIVFYSGSLNKHYGLLHLLDSFELIQRSDFRLYLCGMGDAEEEIKKRATKDKRIIFLGKLPHDKVLEYQCMAHVLVNPRMNNEEFTKYSFPSKNLEYLVSGTPVVAYKLDGIPREYDDFLIYPEDDSIATLAKVIEYAAERDDYGKIADTVLQLKNNVRQSSKIIDLINKLR